MPFIMRQSSISASIGSENMRPKVPFLRQTSPFKAHFRAFMRTSKLDNSLNFNDLVQKRPTPPSPTPLWKSKNQEASEPPKTGFRGVVCE